VTSLLKFPMLASNDEILQMINSVYSTYVSNGTSWTLNGLPSEPSISFGEAFFCEKNEYNLNDPKSFWSSVFWTWP
jgi:hypothetical protein